MPVELERKLTSEAEAKGLTGKHKNAFIYGVMRKTGWVPSTQKKSSKKKIFANHVKKHAKDMI